MSLLSRESLLNLFDNIPTITGLCTEPVVTVQDVKEIIKATPEVDAVPLDKLCEYLNSVIYPCIICKESPGPQCNSKRQGCWERVLTKWMEEQNAR